MRRSFTFSVGLLTVVFFLLTVATVYGQRIEPETLNDVPRERRAQTGMKFLDVSLGARASSLAGAVTAGEQSGAMSIFYNPASLSRMGPKVSATVGQAQWIMDINYTYAAVGFRPANGQYGVVGVSVRSLDYGQFNETIRFDNEKGYRQLGTYSPSATAVGVGYSRVISDRFSVGANMKYANQSLHNSVVSLGQNGGGFQRQSFEEGTIAWDFGLAYRMGFRSMTFAMSVRNLAREVTYAEESFELPLNFRIGLSANMLEVTQMASDMHELRLSLDAERPRDFEENLRAGLEYVFSDILALRAGYGYPTEERSISLGAGLHTDFGGVDIGADYSYTEMGLFGTVHRFAVNLGY